MYTDCNSFCTVTSRSVCRMK